jgi:YD repeat-containing protein
VVNYKKNGATLYTSSTAPSYPLLVDTSLYSNGSTLGDVIINGAAGSGGWVFTYQSYDWKGRPLTTTNADGTQKYASYGGCGCAGGEVTTLTDEMGRQHRMTSDVFGRQWKTEMLNWNGTVYSTTENIFNPLDQVTLVRQTDNATGVYEDMTMSYDGYGRLQSKHVPEQNAGAATVYVYNSDDTVYSTTDARGATSTFTYNNRGLTTNISYGGPSPVPASVSITYDAAGNRTSMSDGTGSVSYAYDQLSRMTSETRSFNGLNGTFTLSYEYTLSGELKAITDPVGSRVDYAYDNSGRLTSATGSGPISASVYASNFGYRAWGAVKDFDFGNGVHQHLGFNSRLQNTAIGLSNLNSGASVSWTNQYYADGKLSTVSDSNDPRFDRAFDYDHAGRIAHALTGSEARGGTTADGPFRQSYSYDVWENAVGRSYRVWTQATQTDNVSYANNRHQYWGYDNQGHVTADYDASYGYDAAGHQNSFASNATVSNNNMDQPVLEVAQTFDGNNAPARKTTTSRTQQYVGEQLQVQESVTTNYYLRATPLGGQVVAELDNTGYKRTGYIFVGGMRIARQDVWNPGYGGQVFWLSTNPATGSEYSLDSSRYVGRKELDPLGADVTNPPDHTLVSEPSFYDPKFNLMPIEYTGGPLDDSIPDWYLNMANAEWDANQASNMYSIGRRDLAQAILAHNPNVGIVASGHGVGLLAEYAGGHVENGSLTLWGSDAATALGFVPLVNKIMAGSGDRVALSGEDLERYKQQRDHLVELLRDKGSDCSRFLKKQLGLNGSRLAKTVLGIRAFDGPASMISMGDAGLVPRNYNGWPQHYLPTGTYFKVDPVYAATAMFNKQRLGDVYFNPSGRYSGITAPTILHESLHLFLGIVDDFKLEERLGLRDPDTHSITVALSNAGCK